MLQYPAIIHHEEDGFFVEFPVMLKSFRDHKKITQTQLAEKMHVKPQTYQKQERVKKSNPSVKTPQKIARALGKKLIVDFV